MPDPLNLQPAIERTLGQLLFQATTLQAQNEQLRAELQAKGKELAAANLAMSVLQPAQVTIPQHNIVEPLHDGNGQARSPKVNIPKPSEAGKHRLKDDRP